MAKHGLIKKMGAGRAKYDIFENTRDLKKLTVNLPEYGEVYKYISFSGGFASINFIKLVADNEPIIELMASTLRIGEKQFEYMARTHAAGRIKSATFFIGSLMREDENKHNAKYDYYRKFVKTCERTGWRYFIVNNHSKIILMRTKNNYYVLETSSNLNENPKIEQYSFENNIELYDFYYAFFKALAEKAR
mgnify:CR=1 FL=1